MWGRLLAATALAVLFGGASASAQGYAQLSNWCYGQATDEQTVRGCTAVIQWARESPRDTGAAFYNRGIAFASTGRLDRALSDYGNALRLRPDADVFNNRGIVWRRKGYPERALADFDSALALKPASAAALFNRGLANADLGRLGAALADFDRALGLQPGDADILKARTLAAQRQSRTN